MGRRGDIDQCQQVLEWAIREQEVDLSSNIPKTYITNWDEKKLETISIHLWGYEDQYWWLR